MDKEERWNDLLESEYHKALFGKCGGCNDCQDCHDYHIEHYIDELRCDRCEEDVCKICRGKGWLGDSENNIDCVSCHHTGRT